MTKFIIAELRLYRYIESIPWSRDDKYIGYKVESILNGYEFLITQKTFDLDPNSKHALINDMSCCDRYQSVSDNKIDFNIDYDFITDTTDDDDNIDAILKKIDCDDNIYNLLQCKNCNTLMIVPPRESEGDLLQSVCCGQCGAKLLFYYEKSKLIKTIPIAINVNGTLNIISFIEVRYKKYSLSPRKYVHKYSVYYDLIKTQQVSIFDAAQSVLTNPWYTEHLSASLAHFQIAPMVMPMLDPFDLSTKTKTNATNQNVEIEIKSRKGGQKKKKATSFQEYVQETHEISLNKITRWDNAVRFPAKVKRKRKQKRRNKNDTLGSKLDVQCEEEEKKETAWNPSLCDEDMKALVVSIQERMHISLSDIVCKLRLHGIDVNLAWFQNRMNRKNTSDIRRDQAMDILKSLL